MKKPVIIAIALVLGAMAAYIAARMSTVQTDGSEAKVVIVAMPIDAGKVIAPDQIKAVQWPSSAVPLNAFARTADVVGRVARVSMIAGEPVLPDKLALKGAKGGLASTLPEGKRAITVKVNEVIAVAGFALPGSYVDILVNGKDDNRRSFSRTVLSRVKVLAVDQVTTGDPDKPKLVNAVTVELSPREAEKLDLARNIGNLSLVLRNELDTAEVNSEGVRLPDIVHPQATGDITSSPDVQVVSPRQNRGPEEIRGTSRESVATP
ncbi:Flp pilus assembly protein CpaB [Chlorobaculum parvum NCIB 8327]|uniref:Flp pilus assembly protein CpaB n=1 Tax=Chlorobaculum parvum (strain DSM 263 / NCIMB 8327) TaxID=517417 RepID=B3QPL6_CHLP8|nr:Flp pilus assembly protein CpaB [Chlorobaculum parvum]ACF11869.1 Flp pilus assembly protein CpaB [Chlorobaculum parvum NCIB 8327]